MIGLRLSGEAENDLRAIYAYGMERFGSDQAARYAASLDEQFDLLCRHPEAARLRTEFQPPVRVLPHGAHIIVYEIIGPDVVVLRVRSARENWMASPLGAPS